MKFDIKGNPSYGEVDVDLGPGEVFLIEPGAMSRMSSNMKSSFQRQGGFFSAMCRKIFGGENFLLGKYVNENGGTITFATSLLIPFTSFRTGHVCLPHREKLCLPHSL